MQKVLSGRYQLEEEIGAGGFGAVYRGLDQRLNRPVAVKLLHRECSANQALTQRFLHEAQITASLQHPNTLRIFDYGKSEEGALYIVSELLQGEPLSDLLERAGTLSADWLIPRLIPLLLALDEAHERGVIHRDLKPDNLFLHQSAGEERLVMIDFGISKSLNMEGTKTLTGQLYGTPFYMAPEQIRQDPKSDRRVDLYSLGVILFQCLSGQLPFDGESVFDVLRLHLEEAPPLLYTQLPEGHRGDPQQLRHLERIISGLLEKAPTLRTPSARDLHAQLSALFTDEALDPSGVLQLKGSTSDTSDMIDRGLDFGETLSDMVDWPAQRPSRRGRALQLLLISLLSISLGFWLLPQSERERAPQQSSDARTAPLSPSPPAPTVKEALTGAKTERLAPEQEDSEPTVLSSPASSSSSTGESERSERAVERRAPQPAQQPRRRTRQKRSRRDTQRRKRRRLRTSPETSSSSSSTSVPRHSPSAPRPTTPASATPPAPPPETAPAPRSETAPAPPPETAPAPPPEPPPAPPPEPPPSSSPPPVPILPKPPPPRPPVGF